MNTRIRFGTLTAFCLTATLPAHAQTLRYDGIQNTSLGSAAIQVDAADQLVVSNLGSSGQDGVRIDLGSGQGASVRPQLDLGTNGSCRLTGEALLAGGGTPAPVTLSIVSDGAGAADYMPDYSSLGLGSYTLRVMSAGQVIFEQGGNTSPTKMQSGLGLNALPQKVYMLTNPFGPWGGAYLTCFEDGGGITVTPPGGTPLAADFVEILSDPAGLDGVGALEWRCANVSGDLVIGGEDLRHDTLWMRGLEDAHIDAEPSGKLKISNLGSSAQDGASIAAPSGTAEMSAELDSLAAPNHTGGQVRLESRCGSGEEDSVLAEEVAGEWLFTPDFSALGSATYRLELFHQGQMVYAQDGMSGPAVSCGLWGLFYKKKTTYPDGTTTTEWCIGGGTSTHRVVGGPAILADMFTVRSESIAVVDANVSELRVRAADMGGDLFLSSIATVEGCVGASYCVSAPNSVGSGATMCSSGSSSVAANDLVLSCTGLPVNQFGIFFYGPNQIQAAFGNGFRCVGGQTYRLPLQIADASGAVSYALDNTNPPQAAGQINAGDTWNFQFWYRDPAGGGSAFNLSDGHAISFTP